MRRDRLEESDLLTTPNKQEGHISFNNSYNSSRGFSSRKRHRNSIFKSDGHASNTRNWKQSSFSLSSFLEEFGRMKLVMSDDFCGCDSSIQPCEILRNSYFKNVNLKEMKSEYERSELVRDPVSANTKQQMINRLPKNYPEIFTTHLKNLLNNFSSEELNEYSFLCLAWVQYHCKLEYVSYFFYRDLKHTLNSRNRFLENLDIALIKYHTSFEKECREYEKLYLRIKEFVSEFYESAGATVIPLSQYAKFLEIVKFRGENALVLLMCLFLVKKRNEFYNVLKFSTHNEKENMRIYSRELSWESFFEELEIMQ